MTDYLLDTNHISPLVTIGHPLRSRILTHAQAGDTFFISAVALSEFLYGISILPRARQNLAEWKRLRSGFNFFGVDTTDAEQAATLRLALRQQGVQLSLTDALIAVVSLRNNLTLLTTDKDFLAVPTLKQENWRTLT